MLRPSIFGEDLFDDWFAFPDFRDLDRTERKLYGRHADRMMKTDVHEHDDHYEVDIDLPGFKKEEIGLELNNGYLIVSANKGLDKDEKDKKGKENLVYTPLHQSSFSDLLLSAVYHPEPDDLRRSHSFYRFCI